MNTFTAELNLSMKKTTFMIFFLAVTVAYAQETVVPLPFGDMNKWIKREVKESFVIGGNTRILYEIADSREQVPPNTPFHNKISPWATSSVYAKVNGVTKGSVTVFPEKRDNGYAARLETRIESVRVLGIININALASGTIFLGQVAEPITDTKNPLSKILIGIPFSGKPSFLQFDYKVITGGPNRKVMGLSKEGTLTGTTSRAIAYIFLQKRWEDKEGNIHARRIGTGWEIFDKSVTSWQNNHRIPIHYGNISEKNFFTEKMGLKKGNEAYYTRNSKGKVVPITEDGWGSPNEEVTHLFIQFSSSDGGPFVGNTDSRFWVDNVALVYEK